MIVLFLLLPVATLTMMEFLHGTFIYNWTPAVFAENYVFMLVIYLVFFAITGNIHTPVTLANILCYIFGMVNHFGAGIPRHRFCAFGHWPAPKRV